MLGLKNSFFLPLGVWSSNTQLRFSGSKNMGSSLDEDGEMIIQCVTIDSLIHGFLPNLIKFDVEGAEVEALIGCRNLITESKPDLCISLYHRPEHLFQIPLMIHSWCLDYKFYMRVHEENTFGVVLYCYSN
jgi:hypothetical protein